MYEQLSSSGQISKLHIKNRLVMVALGLGVQTDNGKVTDEVINFYEARAKGGVGTIITGITRVKDGAGAGQKDQLAARGWQDIEGLRRLAKRVHSYDTRLFLQLHHPGSQLSALMHTKAEAPSAICDTSNQLMPHELTIPECEELVQCFIRGARVAQLAGVDGVELHAAHFYLINQFLSPHYNKRTDQYGGTLENRMKFLLDIIKGIKEKCGNDYPVIVRIMADEYISDGNDLTVGIQIAKRLEEAGVDAIDVSCGGKLCIEPPSCEQGSKRELVSAIKRNLKIPVIAVNNIKEPAAAEKLLKEGVSDFIGMGRGLIADPKWMNKAMSGHEDEIIKCISCFRCYNEISQMKQATCTVNHNICQY